MYRGKVGGGHSGLGRCRPSMSGVSRGLWVALVGVQSPERGLRRLAVRQSVRDGEAGVPFELRQHHQHLPAEGDIATRTSSC